MPTTRSNKELEEEIERLNRRYASLKKELYLYKNKYQLSSNYDIVKKENAELTSILSSLRQNTERIEKLKARPCGYQLGSS